MAEGAEMGSAEDPFNEAVATTGLFLLLTAIIAVAFALASWGLSELVFAGLSGAVAVLSFAASIFCFASQGQEPVPVDVAS